MENDGLEIGLGNLKASWTNTGFPLSFSTTGTEQEITMFDSAVLGNLLVIVASGEQAEVGGDNTLHALAYATITTA